MRQTEVHTIARITDTIASRDVSVEIDTVLIKVASRCNINCEYCYVYNMGDNGWKRLPKRISSETIVAIGGALRHLRNSQQSGFAVVLHGGEPLLIGEKLLDALLSRLRQSLPVDCSLNIQTNGILLTNRILGLCTKHQVSLSISLDGPAEVHDKFRVGHLSQKTHARVEQAVKLLTSHKDTSTLYSGLLAVIDPMSEPAAVYNYLKSLQPPSIDFLPRDGNHAWLPFGKSSRDSTECGEWLCRLLDLYIVDADPPKIRLLDDMIKLIMGGSGEKEGIGLTDYGIIIIDTDGSITKNDTLKSTFNGADQFEDEWSVHDSNLAEITASNAFLEAHKMQQPGSSICKVCPELAVCGGGMPLHRWNTTTGFDNPSVYCSDQKLLISHIRERLKEFQTVA